MEKTINTRSVGFCMPDFLEDNPYSLRLTPVQKKIRQRIVAKRRRIRKSFELSRVEKRLRGLI